MLRDDTRIQLDLHATALAVAGVSARPEWKLDGVNLLPFIAGERTEPPHSSLFWRFGDQMAIRQGDFKLVRYDVNADTQTGGRGQGVTKARLYTLREDIGETKDLAGTMPEKVRDMQAGWDTWNAGNREPLWGDDVTRKDNSDSGTGAKKKKRQTAVR